MVHFAADTEWVYMSTHLKGRQTEFLPFNKGLNDGNLLAILELATLLIPTDLKRITSGKKY